MWFLHYFYSAYSSAITVLSSTDKVHSFFVHSTRMLQYQHTTVCEHDWNLMCALSLSLYMRNVNYVQHGSSMIVLLITQQCKRWNCFTKYSGYVSSLQSPLSYHHLTSFARCFFFFKNPYFLNFFQHCVWILYRFFPWLKLGLYFQCSCCQKYRLYWQMF